MADTDPTERALQLLSLLQTHRFWPGDDLAEWTAATAVIAGGMALLAVLLRSIVTRQR